MSRALMRIHPSHRAALRPIALTLLLLAVFELVIWLPLSQALPHHFKDYAQLHLLLEIFAIVVSCLAFGVCWSIGDRERPANLMVLASSCLAVALFDLLHVMSYSGMPDLVTPAGPEKAINFWLGARTASVAGLLAFVFLPPRRLRRRATRWEFLGATLLLVGGVAWMGLWHPEWAPRTFLPDSGLTEFKLRFEYLLVMLFGVVAFGLLNKMRVPQAYDAPNLFAATCVLMMSEWFFTGYTRVNDAFNLFGHVYKIVAYGFIYRSVFNSAIRTPNELLSRSRDALDRSHKLLQGLIETIPLRVFWQDREARYQGCNSAFASDVGVAGPQAVVGKRDADLPQQALTELLHRDDQRVIAGNAAQLNHDAHLTGAGAGADERWLRASTLPLRDAGNNVIGVLGIYDDITEHKRVEQFQQLTAAVYESSSEAIIVSDANNVIVSVNPAFVELTGYRPDEVLGHKPAMMGAGFNDRELFTRMAEILQATDHWRGEMWCRHRNGEPMAIFNSVNTIRDAQGRIERYVGSFSDITQRKKSEELIWRQANFDPLTSLPNRRMFYDRLDQELKKAARTELPVALMLLDLDLFKEVNDTLGHDMGDQLLKEAARRIAGCVRDSDTVARLGGDEFSVVLGELVDVESVERVAEEILARLAEPFQLAGEKTYVSASIGITLYPADARDIEGMFKNADQAMYAAKRAGRSRCSYFTSTMQELAQKRMRLANDLRGAVGKEEFRLHYQPIVDMQGGQILKAEALIRWQHPTRGLIGPGEFIQIAEDTGMIVDIGDWVFEEAVRQVSLWRQQFHKDFQISVNKSPVQFRQESGGRPWIEHLQRMDVDGGGIVVEITEGLLMDASANVKEHLLEFRDAGIHVSLDDFGTGYSSLSYLKKFDIDYLKIDQTFVRNLEQDAQDQVLCEAIIVMAHKLGMKVVAEGVETRSQRDMLAGMGCDYAQGYFYSKPIPPEEFERLLMSARPGSASVVPLPLTKRL